METFSMCCIHEKEIILFCVFPNCDCPFNCISCLATHYSLGHEPEFIERRYIFSQSETNISFKNLTNNTNNINISPHHSQFNNNIVNTNSSNITLNNASRIIDLSYIVDHYKHTFKKVQHEKSRNLINEMNIAIESSFNLFKETINRLSSEIIIKQKKNVDNLVSYLNDCMERQEENRFLNTDIFLDHVLKYEKEMLLCYSNIERQESSVLLDNSKHDNMLTNDKRTNCNVYNSFFDNLRCLKRNFLDKTDKAIDNVSKKDEYFEKYLVSVNSVKAKYKEVFSKLMFDIEDELTEILVSGKNREKTESDNDSKNRKKCKNSNYNRASDIKFYNFLENYNSSNKSNSQSNKRNKEINNINDINNNKGKSTTINYLKNDYNQKARCSSRNKQGNSTIDFKDFKGGIKIHNEILNSNTNNKEFISIDDNSYIENIINLSDKKNYNTNYNSQNNNKIIQTHNATNNYNNIKCKNDNNKEEQIDINIKERNNNDESNNIQKVRKKSNYQNANQQKNQLVGKLNTEITNIKNNKLNNNINEYSKEYIHSFSRSKQINLNLSNLEKYLNSNSTKHDKLYLFNKESKYGKVMIDSLDSKTDMRVFYQNNLETHFVFEFNSFEAFLESKPIKIHQLKSITASTYSTIYANSLYYIETKTNKLIKYDLISSREIKKQSLELLCNNDIVFNNKIVKNTICYTCNELSDVILLSGKEGLFAVYSNKEEKVVLMKINPVDLSCIYTTELENCKKKNDCGAFFLCNNRIYCIKSFTESPTNVSYCFDIDKKIGVGNFFIEFENKGGMDTSLTFIHQLNSMITVNNGKLFLYDVNFLKKSNK